VQVEWSPFVKMCFTLKHTISLMGPCSSHLVTNPMLGLGQFHVHIDPSLLAIGVVMSPNLIGKSDQPMYASRHLKKIKQNYNTTHIDALAMVFALHKFRHYLLGNKFIFYVDHMVVVYLVNKPQVSRRITRWLLLFL